MFFSPRILPDMVRIKEWLLNSAPRDLARHVKDTFGSIAQITFGWASFKSCEIFLSCATKAACMPWWQWCWVGGEGDDDKGLQSSSSAKRLQYSADTLCFALCRKTKILATITHRSGRGDCRMANLFLPIHQRRRWLWHIVATTPHIEIIDKEMKLVLTFEKHRETSMLGRWWWCC